MQAEPFIWDTKAKQKKKVEIPILPPEDGKQCWERDLPGVPRVDFSIAQHRTAALHILYAQRVLGKPSLIQMDCDETRTKARRRSWDHSYPRPGGFGRGIWERDEYPPASCFQGGVNPTTGEGPSIWYIPWQDNNAGGQVWKGACALWDGFEIEVCVRP